MRPLNVTGRRWAPACTNTAIETGRSLNGAAKGVKVRHVISPALMAGQTLTATLTERGRLPQTTVAVVAVDARPTNRRSAGMTRDLSLVYGQAAPRSVSVVAGDAA